MSRLMGSPPGMGERRPGAAGEMAMMGNRLSAMEIAAPIPGRRQSMMEAPTDWPGSSEELSLPGWRFSSSGGVVDLVHVPGRRGVVSGPSRFEPVVVSRAKLVFFALAGLFMVIGMLRLKVMGHDSCQYVF